MNSNLPKAKRVEYVHEDGRVDHYHWLRDKNWPDVKDQDILDYLRQENSYTESVLNKEKSAALFIEMKNGIEESDCTIPYFDSGYWYSSAISRGQEYWVHKRKDENGHEQVLLDENMLASQHKYLRVGCIKISPDHTKIAYSADYDGSERYHLYIKEIITGSIIESEVSDVLGNFEWDESGIGIFYTPAGELWRADRVLYHKIGEKSIDDRLLYQELDTTFSVSINKSSSKHYIFFISKSATATEYHFINSDSPDQETTMMYSRMNNHLYNVVHHDSNFFLRINDHGPNFRVVRVSEKALGVWTEVIPHSAMEYIQNIYAFEKHLVLSNKHLGLTKIRIIDLLKETSSQLDFEEESYELSILQNTFRDDALRVVYSSLKTPRTIIDYDFVTLSKNILKVQNIPSGFDQSRYTLKRIWASSEDEVKVPISLIYDKEKVSIDGSAPLYLYGYGSYGYAVPDNFRHHIFSLVDRGFVYAIAHIRGGDELGKGWHEDAKFLKKKNTFIDFIKSAEALIDLGYTKAGNIAICGGSAGGMLVGACINMRPDLYKVASAHVPFVDVLSTMLDDNLPLTPGEFKEWGNPKEKEFYEYIKSYSPYDNVKPQEYPNIFVTAGLSDPRVTYWEPAKWVALLRHTKLGNNFIVYKTDMDSGHGGPSGRFNYLKEMASEYSFILDLYGL